MFFCSDQPTLGQRLDMGAEIQTGRATAHVPHRTATNFSGCTQNAVGAQKRVGTQTWASALAALCGGPSSRASTPGPQSSA